MRERDRLKKYIKKQVRLNLKHPVSKGCNCLSMLTLHFSKEKELAMFKTTKLLHFGRLRMCDNNIPVDVMLK